jgi:hypothetical protein
LDFHVLSAKRRGVTVTRLPALPVLLVVAVLGAGVAADAQIEGGDRGVPPIDSTSSFEVSGIKVDVAAKNATAARLGGWRLAQRRGWDMLWAKTHGGNTDGPKLSDSDLDAIVSGIAIEDEAIGPTRYVARLGILFDRARTSELLGVGGNVRRSPPLLVIPVEWSGGTPVSFEQRSQWQRAWARFRAGASPIDYVRPTGIGADPLLLTAGQTLRRGRNWWRMLLDQYGAVDIVVPEVRLTRLWPGGPASAHFTARYGPDSRLLGSFDLKVDDPAKIDDMLDEGVRRIDALYTDALASGVLRTDPSLIVETPAPLPPEPKTTNGESSQDAAAGDAPVVETQGATTTPPAAAAQSFTVQFDTPDVASVSAIEAAVRGAAGVSSASTSSLALGGTSVMRVTFAGDAGALRSALSAAGLRVEDAGGILRIGK